MVANGTPPPHEIVAAILAAVSAWMHVQDDDLSLLVFRYTTPPGRERNQTSHRP